jgi:hypothetical protein
MRKIKFVIPILFLFLLASCAQLGLGSPTDFTKMNAKQKAVFFMKSYNDIYAQYKTTAALPNLTDIQKQVLRIQKPILVAVYPLIQAYDLTQAEGKPIDPATETQILAMINQLIIQISTKK